MYPWETLATTFGLLGHLGVEQVKMSKVMVFGSDSSSLKFLTKKIHVSSALPRR